MLANPTCLLFDLWFYYFRKVEKRMSLDDGGDVDEDGPQMRKIRKKRSSINPVGEDTMGDSGLSFLGEFADGKKTRLCEKITCAKSNVKPVCCVGLSSKWEIEFEIIHVISCCICWG